MNWQLSVPTPALLVVPAAVSLDDAHSAIELWEYYSRKVLDSSQRLAVELMLAEGADGRWAARTTGRTEPRQNGKGDEIEVVEAWGLLQRDEWIYHTAHEIPTAEAAHKRLVDLLMGHRDLRRKVAHIRYANGTQAIQMVSGGIVVYRTRTAGGGRGLDDISRIVVDEAQYAQSEQLAAATPILAVNPNPQTNFVGTGGIEGRSEWWWGLRKRALRVLAGEEGGEFSYLEHSAETVELNRDGKVISTRPDPEDRTLWPQANPALGTRIEEGFLAEQLGTLGPQLFAREHLGVWDPYPGDDEGFLPYESWTALKLKDPGVMRSVCYGLAVSDTSAAVASAGRLSNGHLYVDTVHEEPGTEWVLPYLTDLHARKHKPIHVDPSSAAGAFVRPLREAGVKVEEVTSRVYQQACGEILDTVKNGAIRHLGQTTLDRAVRSAQRRDIGRSGGWVWAEPSTGVDLSTLKAATVALTGVTARRPPQIHVLEG
jgi:hypothetical protein